MALTFLVTVPGSDPQTITLDQPRVVIGRGAQADVRLPSRAVSEQHALIRVDGPDVSIVDEGSTNGTRVNGATLARGRRKFLFDGDEVGVGDYAIKVSFVIALADPPVDGKLRAMPSTAMRDRNQLAARRRRVRLRARTNFHSRAASRRATM